MGEEQRDGVRASALSARVAVQWRAWRDDRRVVAVVCACTAVAAGAAWWRAGTAGSPPPAAPRAATTPTTRDGTTTRTVASTATTAIVDVEGAVRHPGIVRLPGDARVFDAIAAAGGTTTDADLARVNLAAKIGDGSRVSVPKVGAPAPAVDPSAVSGPDGSGGMPGGSGASGPVDLNSATAAQLDALPGVGPATAAAIVREREAHGPYRSVDDLRRVRGIGPAKLAQLHDLVTV